MSKGRMEAFTDGVLAIIITIMILDLRAPSQASFSALWDMRARFLIYIVSFFTIAVYWNNHHHLFLLVKKINGNVLWTNILFLFAISFVPFVTSWVGADHIDSYVPEMTYGVIVLLTEITFYLLIRSVIRANGVDSEISQLLGRGYYKPILTIALALVAILAALVWPPATILINFLALLLWIRPEKRIERHIHEHRN